jgi:glutamate/tyrosine decarboxylase-like PLP-dependent enzyme
MIACARDYLYCHSPHLSSDYSYAQDGPPSSPTLPSPPIIILALHPHYSILKVASLVGIGAGPRVVQTIPASHNDELAFDMTVLRERLQKEKEIGRGVIVSYGLGEVNTGGIGSDLDDVAELCEELGAWLHVDAGTFPLSDVIDK